MTKLLNDTFDVLNGRCYQERITILNWHVKKIVLDDMLCVLDQSEQVYKETGTRIKMFASITTIRAWKLSIRSAITLIKEMFNAGFYFVPTG